jgi:hypothetical protein
MSAFHYKAVLLSSSAEGWEYRFFPDFFRTEEESGRFLVEPGTWEVLVLEEVKDGAGAPISYAARCIPALLHQIRRAYDTEASPPKSVTHVA